MNFECSKMARGELLPRHEWHSFSSSRLPVPEEELFGFGGLDGSQKVKTKPSLAC